MNTDTMQAAPGAPATLTFNLGLGWYANFNGDRSITIRNPDKGQRIDLPVESADRLRNILRSIG